MDQAKIESIEKLPTPSLIKTIWSFLGHVGFYKRFIKDFLKIMKPLCMLLEKGVPFIFDKKCMLTFQTLKLVIVFALVIITPN